MGRYKTLVLAGAVAGLLSLVAPSAAQAGAEALRPIRATHGSGARIVDDQNRTVILRGVNVNGLGEYYQEWPDLPSTLPLTDADYTAMAADGFNVQRLIVTWSRLEPTRGRINTAYIERIAANVAMAKAHGIYTLIDMHQDAWGPAVGTPNGVTCPPGTSAVVGWDGAPAWTTQMSSSPLTCAAGAVRELSIAVQASFTNFYANVGGVQTHLVNVWRAIAQRFAHEPAVAGYDLLNEPNPGLAVGVGDYALLGAFYTRAINAIRSVDKAHAVFFEPAVITGFLGTPGPLPVFTTDTNVVYAPHLYNESSTLSPGTIEQGFTNANLAAKLYGGTPIFSGEWGWFGNNAADQQQINRYAAQEDAQLISGTWWQWKQACGDPHAVGTRDHRPGCAGKSIYSDGLVTRSPANRAVLRRSYVRAAPGRLLSMRSNIKTGQLDFTGTTGTGEADVWACGTRMRVPVRSAGNYHVTVRCSPDGNGALHSRSM